MRSKSVIHHCSRTLCPCYYTEPAAEYAIASRQVNITANRSTGKVKIVLPGDQINRYTVRAINQTNLTQLIHRLIKARDYLAKGEDLPF